VDSLRSLIGEALWRAAEAGPPRSPWMAWFEPLSILVEDDEPPLLGAMAALWMLSPELQKEFALESRKERVRFVGWCCTLAAKDFALMREAAILGPARDIYFRPSRLAASFPGGSVPVPFAVAAVFGFAEQGDAREPEEEEKLARAMLKWQIEKAEELFGGTKNFPAWFLDAAEKAGPDFAREFAFAEAARRPASLPALTGEFRKGGVNIYGPPQSWGGDGEEFRCGAAALAAAGIAHFAPLAEGAGAPIHDVNIFFMTALETLRLFCMRGAGLFLGRRNIGAWSWDLPEFPRELAFSAFLVDEIWAPSLFARRAFEMVSPVPVVEMPPAVPAPAVAPDRARFGLPEGEFLFLASADDLASLSRANPLAAIRAFRAAFPAPGGRARLVVKTVPGTAGDERRAELDEAAAEDSRIILIDKDLPHEDRLALIASCDCLVSLHRATGFGRTLAEALVLGLPVVATHWSGNVDYAETGEQYLVEAKKVAPAPGEDIFGEGQLWAEPDRSAAAAALGAALADRCRAAPAVPARFSPETVGARYARRLELYGVKGSPQRSQSALT
jgi:glycosyltransferase involved in cell wall biosynthesis